MKISTNTNTNTMASIHSSTSTRALFGTGDACDYGEPFQLQMSDPFDFDNTSKDFSSYYYEDGTNADFTDLLQAYRAPCEYYRGVLHIISGSQTCGSDNYDDYGTTYTATNLPYCAFPGCSIDTSTIEESQSFDVCTDNDYTVSPKLYTVEIEDGPDYSILGQECTVQLQQLTDRFLPSSPVDGDFFDWDKYDVLGDGSLFDFDGIVEDYIDACEVEGGTLYKFSERITNNNSETQHYYDEDGYTLSNYPICLGSSCDPAVYFQQLYIPTSRFETEGDFWAADGYDAESGNYTGGYDAQQLYEFLGFEAVTSSTDSEDEEYYYDEDDDEDEDEEYYYDNDNDNDGDTNTDGNENDPNGNDINGNDNDINANGMKDSAVKSDTGGSGGSKAGTFFGGLITGAAFVGAALFAKNKMDQRRAFSAVQGDANIALQRDAEMS